MRPRLGLHRIPFSQSFKPSNSPRLFIAHSLPLRVRAQPPFLSPPTRRLRARFLTTETKQWLKTEFRRTMRYVVFIYASVALGLVMLYGIKHERWERMWPTPSEWSWYTRRNFRQAAHRGANPDRLLCWSLVAYHLEEVLEQLENPDIDGSGVRDREEGGIYIAGVGKTGFDITSKSENWRRGYYETLMGAAQAAEHLDGWVRIRGERFAYPKEVVLGPSNPNPRPVLPGSPPAPKEEECEPAFYGPETFYIRILTTDGFTKKQKMDAALAYGVWLDHKSAPNTALEMYKWALDLATSPHPGESVINRETGILNTGVGLPSANVLTATTALGVHHALNAQTASALPIFLSVLRARRSLPDIKQTMHSVLYADEDDMDDFQKAWYWIRGILIAPGYPPLPDDGNEPPLRDTKELCDEAELMTYIGEILYASNESGREDGLAWTKQAIAIIEEQLRGRGKSNMEGKDKCKKCLQVSVANWKTMVEELLLESKLEQRQSKQLVEFWTWEGRGSCTKMVSRSRYIQ